MTPHQRQMLAIQLVQYMLTLYQLYIKRRLRRRSKRLSYESEITLFSLLDHPYRHRGCRRRFWVDVRSDHWVHNVLGGSLLQEREFEATFRMTRNSFRQLHAILGTFFVIALMQNRTSRTRTLISGAQYLLKSVCLLFSCTLRKVSTTGPFRINSASALGQFASAFVSVHLQSFDICGVFISDYQLSQKHSKPWTCGACKPAFQEFSEL